MAKITVTNEYIDIENNTTILLINSPTHGLKEAYIDTEDKEKVQKYHWNVTKRQRTKDGFNVVTPPNRELASTLLCRYLMDAPKGIVVDHKDGNSLDNRKSNLRICTQLDNGKNTSLRRNNKSGHKGVCWYKHHNYNKWKAYIMVDGEFMNLGYFDDLQEAIRIREEAELKYYGEYSRDLNDLSKAN